MCNHREKDTWITLATNKLESLSQKEDTNGQTKTGFGVWEYSAIDAESIAQHALLMEKALKSSCEKLCYHMNCCPAELISDLDAAEFKCRDDCDLDKNKPLTCWVKYFELEAERQLKEVPNESK